MDICHKDQILKNIHPYRFLENEFQPYTKMLVSSQTQLAVLAKLVGGIYRLPWGLFGPQYPLNMLTQVAFDLRSSLDQLIA